MHATLNRSKAEAWLGRAQRGNGPQDADPNAYIVRIDLSKVPAERVIDLSTHEKQQRFVGNRQTEKEFVRLIHDTHNPPAALAEDWSEVLILGRGCFPSILLEGGR